MIHQQVEFQLPRYARGFHIITDIITEQLEMPAQGIMHVFIKHTSAGLTINENADPSVLHDFEQSFNHIVKENEPFYKHVFEGSDDMPAHIKSTMVGSSVSIPITGGQLNLGTWQGIYLCEFRNRAGGRWVVVTVSA